MASSKPHDHPLLARVSAICAQLPETVRMDAGPHAGFQVRKRTYAWFQNNHHGDEMISLVCKVVAGDQHRLAAAHPDRFFVPSYLGPKGWSGLRLDTGAVDWEEVAELLKGSYAMVAPRKLALAVGLSVAPNATGGNTAAARWK